MKMKRILALFIGVTVVACFGVFNFDSSASVIGRNSSGFYTDDGDADDDTSDSYSSLTMALKKSYYIKNLAKIKTTDDEFGSTNFSSVSFYGGSSSDYSLIASTSSSSNVYSTFSNNKSEGISYMVAAFEYDDVVDMPIYVGTINKVWPGKTVTLSYTETSGTYTYQEESIATLSAEVSESVKASYLDTVECSISTTLGASISETLGTSQSYTVTGSITCSEEITNDTDDAQFYDYQYRGLYRPYVVAIYSYTNSSVCTLTEIDYQYYYISSYKSLELLDYDSDSGTFYLDSSCKISDFYYFD